MFTRWIAIGTMVIALLPGAALAGYANDSSSLAPRSSAQRSAVGSAPRYYWGVPSTSAPRNPAPHYTFRRYDPYDPSTPSLYRRTPRDTQCRLSNSILSMLASPDQYDCGGGWTFPGLIQGNCPVYVCMLKVRHNPNSVFGPMN